MATKSNDSNTKGGGFGVTYGYYAPKHHVPAEGVIDVDEEHEGGLMCDRGETMIDIGWKPRGGHEGKVDGEDDAGKTTPAAPVQHGNPFSD